MARPDWVPEGIDINRPAAARAYDYVLGGTHNFPADRELAKQLMDTTPDLAEHALANRAFLQRSVRFLVEAGVRQFLDIGSGIPTVRNVHEVAQEIAPDSRIAYVDIDPVAIAHSHGVLAGIEGTVIIQEDLRNLDAILNHPEIRGLLKFDEPIAVLLLALIHAIPDSDGPGRILADLRAALAPGSYLVLSHATHDNRPDETHALEEMSKASPTALHIRTRAEVERLFTGFELTEPGLTWVSEWHPELPAEVGADSKSNILIAGVGRRP